MDEKKYSEKIVLENPTEAEELVVKIFMQEGALRFQEQVISALKEKNLHEAVKIVEAVELEL